MGEESYVCLSARVCTSICISSIISFTPQAILCHNTLLNYVIHSNDPHPLFRMHLLYVLHDVLTKIPTTTLGAESK